ncbi:MAG: RSP_2648 family PIN domain-containing protein [Gemmobacter sp.]
MKAVLDTCVLVPPVLCDCLLSVAAAGLFRPLWSDRILGEWVRAAQRKAMPAPPIAAATAAFPGACIPPAPGIEARLHLPDDNDTHVLATAIAAGADAIVTWNAADFPRGVLASEGIQRRDPDGFLWEMWSHDPVRAGAALESVRARAEAMAGTPVALRPLLKRAKLTRLARAMA